MDQKFLRNALNQFAVSINYYNRKYTNMLMQAKAAKQKNETEKYKRELKAADKRISELDKIIARLYEDSALGKISEERYRTMSSTYEQEQRELNGKRGQLSEAIGKAEEAYSNVENFVNLIQRYIDIKELDTKILNELIEKIVVHEKTVNEDGSKSQLVDIYYKFIGFISLPLCIPDTFVVPEAPLQESQISELVHTA